MPLPLRPASERVTVLPAGMCDTPWCRWARRCVVHTRSLREARLEGRAGKGVGGGRPAVFQVVDRGKIGHFDNSWLGCRTLYDRAGAIET